MSKNSIIGFVVVGVLFLAFAIFNSNQQKKYEAEVARYQAYQDSVAAANRPTTPEFALDMESTDSLSAETLADSMLTLQSLRIGAELAAAQVAEASTFEVENDLFTVTFSTLGGQITGVTLKDYEKYAPKGEESTPIQLFAPESANFGMSFYITNNTRNIPVHTMEYVFQSEVKDGAEGAKSITMRLGVSQGAWLEYEYTIYNSLAPERDYLIDYNVRFVNMAPIMAQQKSINIDWSNTSYQNEKGFSNENRYTTIAYRLPGEESIEELGMSEEGKDEVAEEPVNWVAFKQQFFSSIIVAHDNFTTANMEYTTDQPESEFIKNFSAQLTVPYSPQQEEYKFSLYFGPNKYSTLKKVVGANQETLSFERLIPLGWMGFVNRWVVIPVFDFLSKFISSYGLIILILTVLVKLVISPLTYKSYVSMAKMRLLKPQIDALNVKFPKKEDALKRQQATMDIYKKTGVNPAGGCIPMLMQLPIVISLFYFFPASIELRDQPFLWADDLSSYDSILNLPFSIPFYGDHVSLFTLLMAGSLFAVSYISSQQTSSQPQMAGMKFMTLYMMPVMMLFWFNGNSSGLSYYYFLANIITVGQTLVIRRMIDDTKIQAIMNANASKKSNGKKSKFQARYEELLQQQQQQQQAKNKGKK